MIFEIVLKLILSTINGSLIAFQSRSKWSKFWPQVAQSFRRNHNVPPPLVTTRRNKRIFRIEIKRHPRSLTCQNMKFQTQILYS